MKIKNTVFNNKGLAGFLVGYVIFLLAGLIQLLNMQHGDVVLWLNRHSKEEWDIAVGMITNLGLGGFMALVMFLLIFIRLRYAVMGLFNLILVGLFTNILKEGFFSDRIRPLNYFLYDDFSRFLYTTELNYHFSFPSGHTLTVFAILSLMAYFIKKRSVGVILFFMALLIGFSRIYLLQHFFFDVYVGSVFGIICTGLTILFADTWLNLNKREIFQKPIYKISYRKKEQ